MLDLTMRILVVDDMDAMRRTLRGLLQQIGFRNLEEASEGGSALMKLRDRHFGLVISDWYMEPMSGLQLLKEVRSDEVLRRLPFIMITAERKDANVVAAKDAGVSGYIVKPFNTDTLRKTIETVLGSLRG